MSKKMFHEEFKSEDEFEAYKEANPDKTFAEFSEEYDQPSWCTYPDALYGVMGCWSLVGCLVTGEDYCRNCECHKSNAERPVRPQAQEPTRE